MSGGIAILLMLILVVAAVVAAVAYTGLGTALGLRRDKETKDEIERNDEGRPVHTEPTTPYHEHARFDRPPEHHESAREEDVRR